MHFPISSIDEYDEISPSIMKPPKTYHLTLLYIYLYEHFMFMVKIVGKSTSPMDPMAVA